MSDQAEQSIPAIGTIHPAKTLFLRENVGTATGDDGTTYEMTTSMSRSPIVCSSATGKYFTLSWNEIVNLAVAAGIDEPDEQVSDEGS